MTSESFWIAGREDAQSNRKTLHARYLRTVHDPVSVDYLVQMTEDGWRILDVYLDGTISLLALHRSEFTSVLRNQGFEGFIEAMNAKADEITGARWFPALPYARLETESPFSRLPGKLQGRCNGRPANA